MNKIKCCLSLISLGVMFVASTWAMPNTIRFQGRLTDSQGRPITGVPQVRFEIYDALTDGSRVWGPSAYFSVNSNEAGLFSVDIDMGASAHSFFGSSSNLYLQVSVKSGTGGQNQILAPRQHLSNVPYAFFSQVSNTSKFAEMIADDSISTAKIKNDAVNSSKISDHSIMAIDLATGSIRSAQIEDGSIAGRDLEDEAITPDKVNFEAFLSSGLAIPRNAIFLFLAVCPDGYEEVEQLRNRTVVGTDFAGSDPAVPNTFGQEFGDRSHTHDTLHTHGTSEQNNFSGSEVVSGGEAWTYSSQPKLVKGVRDSGRPGGFQLELFDHLHDTNTQNPTASGPTLSYPPSFTVVFCRKL